MADHFRFPVVDPLIGGSRLTQTYVSVTRSILERIRGWGLPEVNGKPVCPPEGHFEVILCKGRNSSLGDGNPARSVRLWFNYPNLYLQAFKSNGVWYRFRDMHPKIRPDGAPAHRYPVVALPFGSGYHNRGLKADFMVLCFGRSTWLGIYKALRDFPNNVGGMQEVVEALTKTCVLFPEALRFPAVREFLIYQMQFMDSVTVDHISPLFNQWDNICTRIRQGREAFVPDPDADVDTFDELLSLVAVMLNN